jgi:hypothetical protein
MTGLTTPKLLVACPAKTATALELSLIWPIPLPSDVLPLASCRHYVSISVEDLPTAQNSVATKAACDWVGFVANRVEDAGHILPCEARRKTHATFRCASGELSPAAALS